MPKKILLVDDDEEEFYIIKMALDLAKIDYDCSWANGLEQAVQMVKTMQPDLILIDINMPRYDGFKCLKKLKEEELLPHTTFVMYSTYISFEDCDKALALGAAYCIHKQENIKLLLNQLVNIFNDPPHACLLNADFEI